MTRLGRPFGVGGRVCRRWARIYAYPGSIPTTSGEGIGISHWARCVKDYSVRQLYLQDSTPCYILFGPR